MFTCSLLPPDADADASGGPWRSRGKEDKTMDSGSGSRASLECRENKENNVRTSVLEACTLLLCLSDFSGCAARGSTLLIPRSFRAHSSTQ